jgi:hypothetical protein
MGCSSISDSHPLVIAPKPEDWAAALARLEPDEQARVKGSFGKIIVPSSEVAGEIYQPKYGPPNGKPIGFVRLDVPAICVGFDKLAENRTGEGWHLDSMTTYMQIGCTEGGIQSETFWLKCALRDSSHHTVTASSIEGGPGVKILWGASDTAIAAEMNQGFALAFLRMSLTQ